MSNRRIRAAFETALLNWAAAQSPPLPLVPMGVEYDPPGPQQVYGRMFHLPGETAVDDLEGRHRIYRGVFQITLVFPAGNGVKAGSDLAEAIDNLFPVSMPINYGGILIYLVSPFSAAPAIVETDVISMAVSCTYRADDVSSV